MKHASFKASEIFFCHLCKKFASYPRHVFYKTRLINSFFIQCRWTDVQKSVMHLTSCCFALINTTAFFIWRFYCCGRCVCINSVILTNHVPRFCQRSSVIIRDSTFHELSVTSLTSMHFLQKILWSKNVILILSYAFESWRFSALGKHFLVSWMLIFFVHELARWDLSSGLPMFFLFLEAQEPPSGNEGL